MSSVWTRADAPSHASLGALLSRNYGPRQVLALHGAGEQDAGDVQDDEDEREIGEDLVQLLPDAAFAFFVLAVLPGLVLAAPGRRHECGEGLGTLTSVKARERGPAGRPAENVVRTPPRALSCRPD